MNGFALVLAGAFVAAQLAPPVGPTSLARLLATLRPGTRDADLARLFTPRQAPPGTYDVFVSEEPLDRVLVRFERLAGSAGVEGAWTAGATDIWEAFGTVGRYDRARLAQLYGARRPLVARGPVIRSGVTVASVTLISPHPDAAMTRLAPGTMIVATDLRALP
jgi:hypothetical protein